MISHDLQQRLNEEIRCAPAASAARITVLEKDGMVTLRGTASSVGARQFVEGVAKRTTGVRGVINEVVVALPAEAERDDREIRRMVKRVLKWNSEVPPDSIAVSVEDGLVTLAGELSREYQKEAASAAVMPLIGIRGFVDAMTVRPRASAEEVEEKIRQALHRHAEIDAERIHVTVDEGKATLRGVARTSAEIAVAESAAWAASGISEVVSHLRSDEELASV